MHDVGLVENTNELLGTNGVTGIKTGTLDTFGANLLFSAEYPIGSSTVTVIGVVLGGTDHQTLDAAITALLAHRAGRIPRGRRQRSRRGLRELHDRVGSDGRRPRPAPKRLLLTWGDTPITATVAADPVRIEQTRVQPVGQVVFTSGSAVRHRAAGAVDRDHRSRSRVAAHASRASCF